MQIHPTAIVSPEAELADDIIIGPFSIIGPKVIVGAGTVVGSHVVIEGRTTIGEKNEIFPFTAIGCAPQDITYRGEDTRVEIGDGNIIRENTTINRGSSRGEGVTRIGDGNFLMAYVHVAHDCQVGSSVIMANAVTLGGHVTVGSHAVIGGIVAIHQFVRVGEFSCIGGDSGVRMDIPPYMLATGSDNAKLYGPNLIGLRRNGFTAPTINAIKKSYRIIFRSALTIKEAVEKIRREVEPLPEVERLIEFISLGSKRGIAR